MKDLTWTLSKFPLDHLAPTVTKSTNTPVHIHIHIHMEGMWHRFQNHPVNMIIPSIYCSPALTTLSVSQRPRQSPYPIISLAEAYDLIFSTLKPLPTTNKKVDSSLRGHVVAETVISAYDIPPSPSSNVDGYALKCEHHHPYYLKY